MKPMFYSNLELLNYHLEYQVCEVSLRISQGVIQINKCCQKPLLFPSNFSPSFPRKPKLYKLQKMLMKHLLEHAE